MEDFKMTDEFFKEMEKETPPPTQEEIDARPKRPKIEDDQFEFTKGDTSERIAEREDRKDKSEND